MQAPVIERKLEREQGESKRASNINITLPYFDKYYARFEVWWIKLYGREVIWIPNLTNAEYKRKLYLK